uniref:Anaphase-promoting complex subunit 2 n=1 Tax=Hydatigena taeniaeformis TaxID=6205 RepID=A0A0R3WNM6_HYDTA
LVVWQLIYTLGQHLSPHRLPYVLEPDITTAADFGIEVNTYVESECLFSPLLPIPTFPILLGDLDAAEQPALFLVVQGKDRVYLWHGWWPENCNRGALSGNSSPLSALPSPSSSAAVSPSTIATTSEDGVRTRWNGSPDSYHHFTSNASSLRPLSLPLEDTDGHAFSSTTTTAATTPSLTPPSPLSPGVSSLLHRFVTARLAALRSAQALAQRIGPTTQAVAVYAGIEPDEFLHLFPPSSRPEEAAAYHLSNGKSVGQADQVDELLNQLENMKFSLKELQQCPRPPDVDIMRLEIYLTDEDFELCQMALGKVESIVLGSIFEATAEELGVLLSSMRCEEEPEEIERKKAEENDDTSKILRRAAKILENFGIIEKPQTSVQKVKYNWPNNREKDADDYLYNEKVEKLM